MTKLIDRLLQHLSAVIIRYHDRQLTDASKKIMTDSSLNPLSYSSNILNSQAPNYEIQLAEYIRECTERYPDRRTLLEYCLNQIVFLKNTKTRTHPYTEEAFEQYKTQLLRMFQDLKTLLKTSKHEACKVKHNYTDGRVSTEVTIVGLINPGITYNSLCYSGTLITQMLAAFHLTPNASDEDIEELTHELCSTHQLHLQAANSARQLTQALADNEALQMALEAERLKTRKVEQLLIQIQARLDFNPVENTSSLTTQQKRHIPSAVNLGISGLFGGLGLRPFDSPVLDESGPAAPVDVSLKH